MHVSDILGNILDITKIEGIFLVLTLIESSVSTIKNFSSFLSSDL